MFRALAVVLLSTLASPVFAGPAQSFDEEAAYASWKANYVVCLNPGAETDPASCERNYEFQTELEQRGWCWVAYDQDMMRPGSSRYLNEAMGEATCPLKP